MPQLHLLVGSKNPVKINAVKHTFRRAYPQYDITCDGVHAPSGVADQPMTAAETLLGAQNRVAYCQQAHQADFFVAIEGGVDDFDYGPATFAYVVIAGVNRTSVGRSANLPLPPSVYQSLLQGQELGPLMDSLFGTSNVKQKGGAISLFTNGMETRESAYTQAMALAMAPFLHADMYA